MRAEPRPRRQRPGGADPGRSRLAGGARRRGSAHATSSPTTWWSTARAWRAWSTSALAQADAATRTMSTRCSARRATCRPSSGAASRRDRAADQFSFAVTLYEALCRAAAVRRGRRRSCCARRSRSGWCRRRRPTSQVPRRFFRILERALSPSPEDALAEHGRACWRRSSTIRGRAAARARGQRGRRGRRHRRLRDRDACARPTRHALRGGGRAARRGGAEPQRVEVRRAFTGHRAGLRARRRRHA